jgi:hypothetical protein
MDVYCSVARGLVLIYLSSFHQAVHDDSTNPEESYILDHDGMSMGAVPRNGKAFRRRPE